MFILVDDTLGVEFTDKCIVQVKEVRTTKKEVEEIIPILLRMTDDCLEIVIGLPHQLVEGKAQISDGDGLGASGDHFFCYDGRHAVDQKRVPTSLLMQQSHCFGAKGLTSLGGVLRQQRLQFIQCKTIEPLLIGNIEGGTTPKIKARNILDPNQNHVMQAMGWPAIEIHRPPGLQQG